MSEQARSIFAVVQQVSPASKRPFRVVETIVTSDGMRTRLCNMAFFNEADAIADMKRREEEQKK